MNILEQTRRRILFLLMIILAISWVIGYLFLNYQFKESIDEQIQTISNSAEKLFDLKVKEEGEILKFKLDRIVEGANSEFEIMMRLLHWSYRIPVKEYPYSWNSNDIAVYKKAEKEIPELKQNERYEDLWEWILLDPGDKSMPQLQWDYEGRRRDATCSFSNLVLQGALMSMGYQARYININSEGVSGHEVTEVWSNEFNKWIYLDATRDYYYFDIETGLPLNLLEIHDKLAEKLF